MSKLLEKKKENKAMITAKQAAVEHVGDDSDYVCTEMRYKSFIDAVEVGIRTYLDKMNPNQEIPAALAKQIAITGISVATEEDRKALLAASEALHDLPWIDTGMPLVNTMTHVYMAPENFVTVSPSTVVLEVGREELIALLSTGLHHTTYANIPEDLGGYVVSKFVNTPVYEFTWNAGVLEVMSVPELTQLYLKYKAVEKTYSKEGD